MPDGPRPRGPTSGRESWPPPLPRQAVPQPAGPFNVLTIDGRPISLPQPHARIEGRGKGTGVSLFTDTGDGTDAISGGPAAVARGTAGLHLHLELEDTPDVDG